MNQVSLIGTLSAKGEVTKHNEKEYLKATVKIEKEYAGTVYKDLISLSLRGDNVFKALAIDVGERVLVTGSLACREYTDKESGEIRRSSTEVSVFQIESLN